MRMNGEEINIETLVGFSFVVDPGLPAEEQVRRRTFLP